MNAATTTRSSVIAALAAEADSLRQSVFLIREVGEDELLEAQRLLSQVRDLLQIGAEKVSG